MPARKTSADTVPPRPKGRPRGFRRDRDCRTCKARNVKCDLNRPSCGICVQQGIVCQGYATTVRWAAQQQSHSSNTSSSTSNNNTIRFQSPSSPTVTAKSATITTTVSHTATPPPPRAPAPVQVPLPTDQPAAPWLAVEENPDDSNWTTHYLKYYEFFSTQFEIARRNARPERRYKIPITSPPNPDETTRSPPPEARDRNLSGVWSLLSQRLSGQIVQRDYQTNVSLLSSHASALAELNSAIKAGDILAIYGIVTLSFLDVYEGPFIDCQWHMHGANALIKLHCDGPESLETLCGELAGLREAISLLSWYDTMGFYFEQNRRNALVFDDWVRDAMRNEFFELVSCPRDTYMVYAEVVKARTLQRGPGGTIILGNKQATKLAMLAIQQMMRASTGGVGGNPSHNHIIVLQDCFRYAAALIATETAHAGEMPDAETVETLAQLGDLVSDQVEAGVPITSGRYRHLACQVTILGHHARRPRHERVVDDYWTRCDGLTRPIYPKGREHSTQAHWTRILGTSCEGGSRSPEDDMEDDDDEARSSGMGSC